jgi:hypothetical protein
MTALEPCPSFRFSAEARTVVIHPPVLRDEAGWMRSVAGDDADDSTIFVTDEPEPWVKVYDRDHGPRALDDVDLAAASQALRSRGGAGPSASYRAIIPLPLALPQPLAATPEEAKVHTPDSLDRYFAKLNEGYMEDLVEQLRSPLGVMPFVGAGMSAPYGFPTWDRFLVAAAEEFGLEDEIREMLKRSDYEDAAERLEQHDPKRFTDQVTHAFRRHVDAADLLTGAISYLPYVTTGPIITTNFDPVLEDAFAAAGRPLQIVDGPREDPTVEAVHQNRRTLLKIHGTYNDRTFRVFTKDEYRRGYEDGPVTLESLAWLTFTNRPLLFLGCSLQADRTVQVLAEIHRRLAGLRHYAILSGHWAVPRQTARQRQLSSWGVSPLWFKPGDYGRITTILRQLVERAASRPLPHATLRHQRAAPGSASLPPIGPTPAIRATETEGIAEQLRAGRLSLFLGAYAHLGALPLGDEFYRDLAGRFDCPALVGDRTAVAAIVASRRGTARLWDEVRRWLGRAIAPSALYQLVSALPAYLAARDTKPPLWVFTTNYDTVLEQQFQAAGEPYHLFYYLLEEGLFAHTSPDGTSRVIERPDAIRELDASTAVVVKLNGGIVLDPGPPEQAVVAASQFERLAAALPECLPACVRTALEDRSMLFLGHGLAEPDVQRLISLYAPKTGWWAVQRPPTDPARYRAWRERATHFQAQGLTTIDADLQEFLAGLVDELTR